MKNVMKQQLINDIVTGLLVAATFAAVVPTDALAQLSAFGTNTQTNVMVPFIKMASYASYGLGTIFVVKGISDVKKHTENPGSNPLNKGLGALGAGGAFLSAPAVAGMLSSTSQNLNAGTASFQVIPGG